MTNKGVLHLKIKILTECEYCGCSSKECNLDETIEREIICEKCIDRYETPMPY
jgi:hypothetical protein